jgi:methionyl-tRNA formyltransferase
MRVAFAGTPEFAREALTALIARGFEIPLVLTQPDRPAGRGMKLQASPVKLLAQASGLSVCQPRSLRLDGKFAGDAEAARSALQSAAPDVMVVAAYGLILPAWVLELPHLGCLNIHGSLLPRWRGAAPIQRAVEAGDPRTGITIMQMDTGLDTGAMLLSESLALAPNETSATLHERLAPLGARLVVRALDLAAQGRLVPEAQPALGVTYAHKIAKSEALLDWRLDAATLERQVRAFDPFPGALVGWSAEAVKVWRSRVGHGQGTPGQVLQVCADGVEVACGRGSLWLLELQRPGGRRLPVAQFLQARPLQVGQLFEAVAG